VSEESAALPRGGRLSQASRDAILKEVHTHRSLLGTDSASLINRSVLAELFAAYETMCLHWKGEVARAEKAERREDQFCNWWTGVKQQLDQHMREHHGEDEA